MPPRREQSRLPAFAHGLSRARERAHSRAHVRTHAVQARRFANWTSAWELPPKPLAGRELGPGSDAVPLTLVPYGASKVYKLSMFPYLAAD